jgi:predicted RNA-binding protein (TIGR00451 family)
MWRIYYDDNEIAEFLSDYGLEDIPFIRINPDTKLTVKSKLNEKVRDWLDRCSIVDKLSILCSIDPNDGCKLTNSMSSRKSTTDRMVNVYSGDSHILSPRLNDGGISFTLEGAKKLCDNRVPLSFDENMENLQYLGLPKVCINDDAIPFVGIGRNVMHGYILGADNHLIPGQPCLIVDSKGNLVAHGTPLTTSKEMKSFKKGIAVKVREGVSKNPS